LVFGLLGLKIFISSSAGIFPAQAIFSQTAQIPASRVEEKFQSLGVDSFFYNKGL